MDAKQILSVLLPNQYVRFIKPCGELYSAGYVKRYLRTGVKAITEYYDVDFLAIDVGVIEVWLKERSDIDDN